MVLLFEIEPPERVCPAGVSSPQVLKSKCKCKVKVKVKLGPSSEFAVTVKLQIQGHQTRVEDQARVEGQRQSRYRYVLCAITRHGRIRSAGPGLLLTG